MSLVSPYKNIEQHTKILIEPHQMNSDIRNHLKFNLKKKVEKSQALIDILIKINLLHLHQFLQLHIRQTHREYR